MSVSSGSGPLVPTFNGFVANSLDGLLLFEACLVGKLHHVPRRPHDRERTSLIKSGSVFIYEENASGIKRWTDGVAWSPSRILGNFLIYRELEKPFPPGEKKRAMKRKRSQTDGDNNNNNNSRRGSAEDDEISALEPPGEKNRVMKRRRLLTDGDDSREDDDENSTVDMPPTPPSPKQQQTSADPVTDANVTDNDREMERQLVGSLVDSYGFRPDGLLKKTMSVNINGVSHHLVSYYKLEDAKNSLLPRPGSDPRLQGLAIRPDLYLKQNFRTPVEETEHYIVDPNNLHAHPGFGNMVPAGYGMRHPYMAPHQGYPMYQVPASSPVMYAGAPAPAWHPSQHSALPQPYGAPAYGGSQGYGDVYNRTPSSSTPQSATVKSEDPLQASYASYGNTGAAYQTTAARPGAPSMYTNVPAQYAPSTRPPPATYASANQAQMPPSPTSTVRNTSQAAYGGARAQGYDNRQYADHRTGYDLQSNPATSTGHIPSTRALDMNVGYHSTAQGQTGQYPNTSYAGYGASPHGYRTGVESNSAVSNSAGPY